MTFGSVRILLPACFLTMGVFCGFGQEAEPDPDELLKTARFVATLQHQDLTGHIRKEGIKFPVGL